MKKGILLVSVGTSQLEAFEKTTLRLQENIQERFSEWSCYLAISSAHILKKMNEKSKKAFLSVAEAVAQMISDGMEEVVIQPTYLLNGLENANLLEQLELAKAKFKRVEIGKPLLSGKEDYIQVLHTILEEVHLEDDQALVLVGHGTSHLSNATYQNLEYTAYTQGLRNIFVGTMEEKSQRMALRKLQVSGYKKLRLMPLLFVAGYHARKDIAADTNSWKCILEENGYEVKPVIIGLGEIEGIRKIFMQHLETAMSFDAAELLPAESKSNA